MTTTSNNPALLPVYLVAGEDELKQQRVVERLHQRLSKEGDLSFNSDFFSGETAKGADIVSACNTLPFASNVRLVQVTNVDRLKKADLDTLIEYLNNPSESSVLLLLGKAITKNSRLYKTVISFGQTAFISCAPFAKKDLNGAVRSMAVSHGVVFTEGAASALIDLVGSNTVALDENIKKISLAHRGDDPVNEGEVYTLVARTAKIKPWEFVNAFSSRNISRCLLILERLEDGSPYRLLSMCVTRIRELLRVQSYERRGEIAKLASVLKLPDWRIKNMRAYARNFSPAELVGALKMARECDQAMKTGNDANTAFLEWLIAVMQR